MTLLVYKLPYSHSFTDRGTTHESSNTLLKCKAQSRSLKNRILKHMFSFVYSGLFFLHSSSGHVWLVAPINYSYWSNAKEHICARYCSNTSGNQPSLKKAPVSLKSHTPPPPPPRQRLAFEREIFWKMLPPKQCTESLTKGRWGHKPHTCFQTRSIIHLVVEVRHHAGLHSSCKHPENNNHTHPALLDAFPYPSVGFMLAPAS